MMVLVWHAFVAKNLSLFRICMFHTQTAHDSYKTADYSPAISADEPVIFFVDHRPAYFVPFAMSSNNDPT